MTSGFDFGGGDLVVDFRHNYNSQEVTKVAQGTINASQVFDLENQIPAEPLGAVVRLGFAAACSAPCCA